MALRRSQFTSRVSRLGILLLVLLVSSLAALPPAAAQVCIWFTSIRTYYTDVHKNVVVGQRGIDCDCHDVGFGVVTPYYTIELLCCPTPRCP